MALDHAARVGGGRGTRRQSARCAGRVTRGGLRVVPLRALGLRRCVQSPQIGAQQCDSRGHAKGGGVSWPALSLVASASCGRWRYGYIDHQTKTGCNAHWIVRKPQDTIEPTSSGKFNSACGRCKKTAATGSVTAGVRILSGLPAWVGIYFTLWICGDAHATHRRRQNHASMRYGCDVSANSSTAKACGLLMGTM